MSISATKPAPFHKGPNSRTLADTSPASPACSYAIRVAGASFACYSFGAMVRIRLLFVWLLLAALPIQGFAAASMLYCAMERTAISQTVVDGKIGQERRDAAPAAAHEMAASMGSPDLSTAGPDSSAMAQDDQGMQGHGCSVCAFSCQAVFIVDVDLVLPTSPPPSVEPTFDVARAATRATTVPDKPPRA